MAQVKVYGLRETLAGTRAEWSRIIHAALVETLGLPPAKRFQRFIGLDAEMLRKKAAWLKTTDAEGWAIGSLVESIVNYADGIARSCARAEEGKS